MLQEQEPRGSNFLEKPISRRSVLKWSARAIAASAGAALVGCGNSGKVEEPFAGRVEITQKGEVVSGDILEAGGYRVFLDKEGLPYKYLDPEGTEVLLDIDRVKQARKFSIENWEPEVAHIISAPKTSIDIGVPISISPDKPFVKDLPEDVLSVEKLAERGVKIIQADNTNLYIRKQAFSEGGLMAQFDGKRKLIIAVVNSSVVVPAAVSDPKYWEVANLLDPLITTIQEYKEKRMVEISEHLEKARNDFKNSRSKNTPISVMNGLESILIDVKVVKYRYENTSSDEELLAEASSSTRREAGIYYNPAISGIEDTAVIFVAAGTMQKTKEEIEIVFDASGKCSLQRSSFTTLMGDFTPNIADSFPSPGEFTVNLKAGADDPAAYPYGAQTAGQVLRHELMHDELIWEKEKLNESEYDTDIKAMEGIGKASENWTKFRDNSGYYFVFSLPNDSGYILTSAQPFEAVMKTA